MGSTFEPFAVFDAPKTVFREHPIVREQLELTAESDLDLKPGAVLVIKNGVASLATDSISIDDVVGVLFGPVKLNATEKTSTVLVWHGDIVKDQVTVAEGANVDTIAAVLGKKGIYIR